MTQSPEERVVCDHIHLLVAGGYIEGVKTTKCYSGETLVSLTGNPSLTLDGYSLLESLRSKGFFDKLQAFAKEQALPLTLQTLTQIVAEYLKNPR